MTINDREENVTLDFGTAKKGTEFKRVVKYETDSNRISITRSCGSCTKISNKKVDGGFELNIRFKPALRGQQRKMIRIKAGDNVTTIYLEAKII